MNIRRPLIFSIGVVVAMAAAAAWGTARLGDQPIATHYGLHGPDHFGPAWPALWMHPIVALALTGLFSLLPSILPTNSRLDRSAGAYETVWMGIVVLLALTESLALAIALGAKLDAARLVPAAVGGFMIVLGNLMGKIRYNYVLGVRTPWTLANERVWDKTHRFMGPWFALWGLLTVATALLAPQRLFGVDPAAAVLIGGAAAVVLLACVYSYLVSRSIGAA